MDINDKQINRLMNINFSNIYQLYVDKIVKKGRTTDELNQVIEWLTGYDLISINSIINDNWTLKEFFEKANINQKAELIKGVICGYRIEEISNPFLKKVRYLDKLVDELAKGKSIDKIKRF